MMVIIAWTSSTTTTIICKVCHSIIINCQFNKQFPIIIQTKEVIFTINLLNLSCKLLFLYIAKFQIYTLIYSLLRSPLQLCFFVSLPVSDPRGVSYATRCSCMAYSWKSWSKIFNRPIFLLHLFRLCRVFFAISSSLSSSSFSNSSRFRSPSSI